MNYGSSRLCLAEKARPERQKSGVPHLYNIKPLEKIYTYEQQKKQLKKGEKYTCIKPDTHSNEKKDKVDDFR